MRSVWWMSSRMLKKSTSSVLASFRGSTYGTEYDSPLRLPRPCLRRGVSWHAGAGRVRLVAFLSILLECFSVVPHERTIEALTCQNSFSAAC